MKSLNIRRTSTDSQGFDRCKVKLVFDNGYSSNLDVSHATANCQIVFVGGIEDVLDEISNDDVVEIMKKISERMDVPKLIVDISKDNLARFSNLKSTKVIHNYISTYIESNRLLLQINTIF